MYINPNTNILILKRVPLDDTYDHTIYFATASAQELYFKSKLKYELNEQSYQRVKRGWMRVNIQAELLYDCNYIMFQNRAFGYKWFYAFLKSVEYVNNNVSEIEFEIDVMQTWMFDYQLEQCYVIREHSETDEIGDNIIPEEVNFGGTYIRNMWQKSGAFQDSDWKICVITTGTTSSAGFIVPNGGFICGDYGSIEVKYFDADANGVASVKTIMEWFAAMGNESAIVDVFMIPSSLADNTLETTAEGSITDAQNNAYFCDILFTATTDVLGLPIFGTFVPKNKKCYTYPYSYFIVTNQQGDCKEFQYEKFSTDTLDFEIIANCGVNPSAILIPSGYKQKGLPQGDLNDSMIMRNFPKCIWATSDLMAKLTQTAISAALFAAALPAGVASAASVAGAASSGASTGLITMSDAMPIPQTGLVPAYPVAGPVGIPSPASKPSGGGRQFGIRDAMVGRWITNSVFGSTIRSSLGDANINLACSAFDFLFQQVYLQPSDMKTIDDYFTAFGYQCNRLKVPNISSRPYWNYTRTADCTIIGSVPADDARKICDVYNHGVTFWKNGDLIGQYNLDNSPTTGGE